MAVTTKKKQSAVEFAEALLLRSLNKPYLYFKIFE